MKKILFLSIAIGLLFAAAASAQDSFSYESEHYSVRSVISAEQAQETAERLEAYLGIFNQYFRFDLVNAKIKLKVRIFSEKEKYDAFLKKLINETRDEFVYLHYSDRNRSELVGFVDASAGLDKPSVTHQSFVQFLRAFVPNPPLWVREGFAVYFESISYDIATKNASKLENLAWLETIKELSYGSRVAEALPLDKLLTLGVDEARSSIQVFYPQAWGLVNYLANSTNKAHNRVLWDALSGLSAEASLAENSTLVISKAFAWEKPEVLSESYVSYLKELKTFRELVLEGIEFYSAGKAKEAESSFTKALALQDNNHIPYYYLGLINYDTARYAAAEQFYTQALAKGADAALTNYALGVNAFADNRFEISKQFLTATIGSDASYQEKVNEILQRIEG